MTEEVLPEYHHIIESWKLTPGIGGVFDIFINGDLVFSKHQANRFIGDIELRMIFDRFEVK